MRRLLHTWRTDTTPPTATLVATPKPREVTRWIIRPVGDRTESEQTDLARILVQCPVLCTVDQLVSDFGGMLRQRQGQHLDTWIAAAQAKVKIRSAEHGSLSDSVVTRQGHPRATELRDHRGMKKAQ